VLKGLQLASRDQIADLSTRVTELNQMVRELEKAGPRKEAAAG